MTPGWRRHGWSQSAGFDDSGWSGVKVAAHSKDVLIAPAGPAVRRIQEIRPVKVFKTPQGDTVVDMGQNMVGWVRIKVKGPAGAQVTLRHFEVLDKGGNVYTANLRAAKADGPIHPQGERATRGLRAALHLPRVPLRGRGGLAGRADDSTT